MKPYIKLYKKRNLDSKTSSVFQKFAEEFANSWDWVAKVYELHPCREEIMVFMQQMKDKGYHKSLRAGQQLWVLMLSRSLKHGLREDQPYIAFTFSKDDLTVAYKEKSHTQEISLGKIQLNQQIEDWLNKLQTTILD